MSRKLLWRVPIISLPDPLTPVSLPQLQRELRRIALAGASLLLGLAVALVLATDNSFALRWLLPSLACWCLVLWQCHSRLHKNRSTTDAVPYPTLGPGNRMTMLRGLLIAATSGFVVTAATESEPQLLFVPALLYTAAALGDALDGHLARRRHHTTLLGEELDTALDALGLLVAPLLAVLTGKLHVSYLLVSIAYYLFQWGIFWRKRRDKAIHPLPPSRLRRQLAGFQMGLVATVLWPPIPAELSRPVGVLFMLPLLIGFLRDWLHVSGRLGARPKP